MTRNQKFNRALLKAIAANKIVITDRNSGAIREAVVKFSFSNEGKNCFFAITSTRNANGLELFGYRDDPKLTVFEYNFDFTKGVQVDMPHDVDASAIKYIESCSIISADEADEARKNLVAAFNHFNQEICVTS